MANSIPHTFRLFESQNPTLGWSVTSHPYGDGDIEKILDPSGESVSFEITSIPSPFARLYLFDQAFQRVAKDAERNVDNLNGNTIYHKLVSDALDVGEVIYNYQLFKASSNLNIDNWNIGSALENLSGYEKHVLLKDTMELYMDGELSQPFDFIDNIWMVSHNHEVIGGTSPLSLFFAASNEHLTDIDYRQGDHQFFSPDLCPLHQRTVHFQLSLHLLFQVHQELRERMPNFYAYLLRSKEALRKSDIPAYNDLDASLKEKSSVELYDTSNFDIYSKDRNQYFLLIRTESSLDDIQSDFIIGHYGPGGGKNTKAKDKRLPMVLQSGYQKQLRYLHGYWQSGTEVPSYVEEQELEQRQLPGGLSDRYPWLTVSDFLTPTLIQLRYPLNQSRFVTGSLQGLSSSDNGFLLPLKPLFFKYFSREDLEKSVNNQPVFNFYKNKDGSIHVTLLIPIAKDNEYLRLERTYTKGAIADPRTNVGAIQDYSFNIGFIPFYDPADNAQFRIMLVDPIPNEEIGLQFYNSSNQEQDIRSIQRSVKSAGNIGTRFYLPRSETKVEISYIEVSVGADTALLIPNFTPPQNRSNQGFDIAIDFGTTATHVELKDQTSGYNISEPLSIQSNEFIVDLAAPGSDAPNVRITRDIFLYHAVPNAIGPGTLYEFPIRTVVSETSASIESYGSTTALAHMNIPFYFQQKEHPNNDTLTTNIKWNNITNASQMHDKARVVSFIETLLCCIRNKILIEGGVPSKSRLTWFFPASMEETQRSAFENIWKKAAQEYLGIKDSAVLRFSESIAPFYNFEERGSLDATYPVVNIDIGGETVDMVVFQGGKPKLLTSAKFAGSAVFGDGYDKFKEQNNGIVRYFLQQIEDFLKQNKLAELEGVLTQLKNPKRFNSTDLMDFYLSLDNNKAVQKAARHFSFNQLITNDNTFKVIYFIFYGAIIYHIAKLLKRMDMDMPANIGFSGNGSKIINLLTTERRRLEQLTKCIIEKVYEQDYHANGLEIMHNPEPKPATSKGGIVLMNRNTNESDLEFDRIVLLGDREDTYVNEEKHNFEVNKMKYKQIDQQIESSVVKEVQSFIELLFDLEEVIPLKHFGIKSHEISDYKKVLFYRMDDSLRKGRQIRQELSESGETIAETLFFYPLIGGLYRLTRHQAGILDRN